MRRGRSAVLRRILGPEKAALSPTRGHAPSGYGSLAAAPVVCPPSVCLAVLNGGLEVFPECFFGLVYELFEDLVELQHIIPGAEVAQEGRRQR